MEFHKHDFLDINDTLIIILIGQKLLFAFTFSLGDARMSDKQRRCK